MVIAFGLVLLAALALIGEALAPLIAKRAAEVPPERRPATGVRPDESPVPSDGHRSTLTERLDAPAIRPRAA